jgi:hypothetical protein
MKNKAKTKPILYISGPLTGYPEYNFPAFFGAEKILEGNIKIINPARFVIDLWARWGLIGRFEEWKEIVSSPVLKIIPMEKYMHTDILAVCLSDGVVVLPGWEKSEGAIKELQIAQAPGLRLKSLKRYPLTPVISVAKQEAAWRSNLINWYWRPGPKQSFPNGWKAVIWKKYLR